MKTGAYYNGEYYPHIGELIRMLIKMHLRSKQELAFALSVTDGAVSKWLKGGMFAEHRERLMRVEIFKIPYGSELEKTWNNLYQQAKTKKEKEAAKRNATITRFVTNTYNPQPPSLDDPIDEHINLPIVENNVLLAEDTILKIYLAVLDKESINYFQAIINGDRENARAHISGIKAFFSYENHKQIINRVRELALDGDLSSTDTLSEIYLGRISITKDYDLSHRIDKMMSLPVIEGVELLETLAEIRASFLLNEFYSLLNDKKKINFIIQCSHLNSSSGYLALFILFMLCRSGTHTKPIISLDKNQCDYIFYSPLGNDEPIIRRMLRASIISKYHISFFYEELYICADEYLGMKKKLPEFHIEESRYLHDVIKLRDESYNNKLQYNYCYNSLVIYCARLGDMTHKNKKELQNIFLHDPIFQIESLLYLILPIKQQQLNFLYKNAIINNHDLSDSVAFLIAATSSWKRIALHVIHFGRSNLIYQREATCIYGAALRMPYFSTYPLYMRGITSGIISLCKWLLGENGHIKKYITIIKEGGFFISPLGKEIGFSNSAIWSSRMLIIYTSRIYGIPYRIRYRYRAWIKNWRRGI